MAVRSIVARPLAGGLRLLKARAPAPPIEVVDGLESGARRESESYSESYEHFEAA